MKTYRKAGFRRTRTYTGSMSLDTSKQPTLDTKEKI